MERIAFDRNNNALAGLARREGEAAARGGIIAACRGGDVGRSIIHGHSFRTDFAQGYGKDCVDRADIAFIYAHIIDRKRRSGIIINNGGQRSF